MLLLSLQQSLSSPPQERPCRQHSAQEELCHLCQVLEGLLKLHLYLYQLRMLCLACYAVGSLSTCSYAGIPRCLISSSSLQIHTYLASVRLHIPRGNIDRWPQSSWYCCTRCCPSWHRFPSNVAGPWFPDGLSRARWYCSLLGQYGLTLLTAP